MSVRLLSKVLFVVALATSVSGCDALKEFADKAKEEAEQAEAKNEAASEDDNLGAKLDKYVTCFNGAVGSVGRSEDYYFTWIGDVDKGPTGKEVAVNGILQLVNVEMCTKALKEARKMEPKLDELDKAGEDYAKKLEKLEKLVDDAYDYYKAKNYKDDNFKKAREMHGPLKKAFDEAREVGDKMRAEFDVHKAKLQQRELDRMEEEGRVLAARHLAFMIEAKKLIRVCDVAVKLEGKNIIPQVELEEFDKSYAATEKAFKKMEEYADKNKAEAKKVSGFSSFAGQAKTFLAAAKDMMRHKRDNESLDAFRAEKMPKMCEGHPAYVLEKYNDMIGGSNSLTWSI